ncbi:hypothetical protein ANOM_002397 [Aspergillus nomiae NRRL 13137]|uniref:SnoaL-like domain-containing protein n=1 Tax=Aspergillus nomiae NRRL (strain ATCC 15546 / NRRL 13137 / CBS 260.88 / M93) TaxID=1509407 RepID=A0A0L1JB47_ASPN3|nr:uncharacterized protein ANOM_002397 [Aspergillus nomiae NRRL 13137]KNG89006.1 hypothetical protein ANOM_002397 [Aspergillus nomiae NRRL 13137]
MSASQNPIPTRDQLTGLARSYFKAVDAKDLDAVLSYFAPDATFTIETAHVTATGPDEIRRVFTDFLNNTKHMRHDITSLMADETNGKVATEHHYTAEQLDGSKNDINNCNFFDVGADGKFTRVVVFMAGASPMK